MIFLILSFSLIQFTVPFSGINLLPFANSKINTISFAVSCTSISSEIYGWSNFRLISISFLIPSINFSLFWKNFSFSKDLAAYFTPVEISLIK